MKHFAAFRSILGIAFGDEPCRPTHYRSCEPPLTEPVFMWEIQKIQVRNIAVDPKTMASGQIERPDLIFRQDDEKVFRFKYEITAWPQR
jgi:hypothetical protein